MPTATANPSTIRCWGQISVAFLILLATVTPISARESSEKPFRAGVAEVDITPVKLPVISSGGFLARSGNAVHDRLFARGMALDDGATRIVLVVADTLFMPRDLCDRVKRAAAETTGVPAENVLIAANHIHSGGSLVGCLGTDADPDYVAQVEPQLTECIVRAVAGLQPAQIGWSSEIDAQDTHCRVFIRRPDCIGVDPFGEPTIRVMMHPGYQNPQYIGPSGPVDNELSVLAVRTAQGKPLGLLANYSMHYFGAAPISADYFGDFVRCLSRQIAPEDDAFVAMISNGTSADLHWMDYSQPRREISRTEYAESVAAAAKRAYDKIKFQDWAELGMVQHGLRLDRRQPDERRWEWAQAVLAEMNAPVPANQQQVYAREAKYLREEPARELVLQTIRIGDLGIAALPTETYAITGLKLKQRSPLADLFTIELANGCEGYIPPPEVLPLGGYNAWPARTAGLQPDAETIITDTLLTMLERLSGKPRQAEDLARSAYARKILAERPWAYWPLGELDGTQAQDYSGHGRHGQLETGYLFSLDGPEREDLRCGGRPVRAVQFVGGRMKAAVEGLDSGYAVEFFFWNGLPNDNRPVTGYLFSRGPDGVDDCPGDHLGIGGTWQDGQNQGRLFFFNGDGTNEVLAGGPVIEPKTWNHVRLVRQGEQVQVYLNFDPQPIISGRATATCPLGCRDLFLGGRSDNFANFEGRIAQASVFQQAAP